MSLCGMFRRFRWLGIKIAFRIFNCTADDQCEKCIYPQEVPALTLNNSDWVYQGQQLNEVKQRTKTNNTFTILQIFCLVSVLGIFKSNFP